MWVLCYTAFSEVKTLLFSLESLLVASSECGGEAIHQNGFYFWCSHSAFIFFFQLFLTTFVVTFSKLLEDYKTKHVLFITMKAMRKNIFTLHTIYIYALFTARLKFHLIYISKTDKRNPLAMWPLCSDNNFVMTKLVQMYLQND